MASQTALKNAGITFSATNCLRVLLVILIPICLLFLFIIPQVYTPEDLEKERFMFQMKWVYIFFLVGLYWMTNLFPIGATAFVALVAIPLFGISQATKLVEHFMSNLNMSIFGSMVLILAVNNSGLPKRLALRILMHSEGSPRWIYVYTYLAGLWIAMWVNSASSTFLMLPVIDEITANLEAEIAAGSLGDERMKLLDELSSPKPGAPDETQEDTGKDESDETKPNDENAEKTSVKSVTPSGNINPSAHGSVHSTESLKLFRADNERLLQVFGGELLYAAAVAGNIGGSFWPYGSPMGYELFKLKYLQARPAISIRWNEASWMLYSWPLLVLNGTIVLVVLVWINFNSSAWLRQIIGLKKEGVCTSKQSAETATNIGQIFLNKHKDHGAWHFKEVVMVILIGVVIILQLTRRPVFISGWADVIPARREKSKTANSTKVIPIDAGDSFSFTWIVVLIFSISQLTKLKIFTSSELRTGQKPKSDALLSWKAIQTQLPWTLVMLIGASGCIGEFSNETVAKPLAAEIVRVIPTPNSTAIKMIFMGLIILSTHFISNTGATVTAMKIWEEMVIAYGKLETGTELHYTGYSTILPAFSVASLCFMVPSSSLSTTTAYVYKNKKRLSAWYFLKMGIPLFLVTIIPTVAYTLAWIPQVLK